MAHQSIPSVPIPPPPGNLSGLFHFVLEKLQMSHSGAGCSYKNPTVGLKNKVQMPYPAGSTPKLHFPVDKLQIPYLWEICNNLIKLAQDALYTNHS